MFKRSLTFAGMMLFFIAVIFFMIGLSFSNQRKEQRRGKEEVRETLKSEEVKILALKEEILTPVKVLKKEVKEEKENLNESKNTALTPKKEPEIESEKLNTTDKINTETRLLPAKLQIDRQSIETGKKLIDENMPVPIIQASYNHIGFENYLKKMIEMGGDLFVGDTLRRKILARVVTFNNGRGEFCFQGLDGGNLDETLANMALFRPREIADEPLINEILLFSRGEFEGDIRCVILLPFEKEAAILGSLKEYLNIGKYDISAFDLVWGHYIYSGNEFNLKLEKGRISNSGEIIELGMVLVM